MNSKQVILLSLVGIACMPVLVSVFRRLLTSSISHVQAASREGMYSIAYVTVPNEDVGKKIAHGLVKGKLAACVNLIPKITSIYEWEGKVEEDSEILLMIKTRTSRLDELTSFVKVNHPYEVCEVITTPIASGNPQYLEWIGQIVPDPS